MGVISDAIVRLYESAKHSLRDRPGPQADVARSAEPRPRARTISNFGPAYFEAAESLKGAHIKLTYQSIATELAGRHLGSGGLSAKSVQRWVEEDHLPKPAEMDAR